MSLLVHGGPPGLRAVSQICQEALELGTEKHADKYDFQDPPDERDRNVDVSGDFCSGTPICRSKHVGCSGPEKGRVARLDDTSFFVLPIEFHSFIEGDTSDVMDARDPLTPIRGSFNIFCRNTRRGQVDQEVRPVANLVHCLDGCLD